jgi:hypothetical protein
MRPKFEPIDVYQINDAKSFLRPANSDSTAASIRTSLAQQQRPTFNPWGCERCLAADHRRESQPTKRVIEVVGGGATSRQASSAARTGLRTAPKAIAKAYG